MEPKHVGVHDTAAKRDARSSGLGRESVMMNRRGPSKRSKENLEIRCMRLIPFDLGCSVESLSMGMDEYVKSSTSLTRREVGQKEEVLLGACPTRFSVEDGNNQIVFDVLPDGYAVAVVHEPSATVCCDKFDPLATLRSRRRAHIDLLSHGHEASRLLHEHIACLRNLVDKPRRTPAADDWGREGLAYVFSLYFIQQGQDVAGSEIWSTLSDEVTLLLEPSIVGLDDTLGFEPPERSAARSGEAEPNLRGVVVCENSGSWMGLASWSSVVVLGPTTTQIVQDYVALETRLQHRWFWVYCHQQEVAAALKSGGKIDVEYIRALRSEADLVVDAVEDLVEPTLGSRYFCILEGLLTTSRLREEAQRLRRRVAALKERQESEENRRSSNYRTVVQGLLFVFTYLSGLSFVHSAELDRSIPAKISLGAIFLLGVIAIGRLRNRT